MLSIHVAYCTNLYLNQRRPYTPGGPGRIEVFKRVLVCGITVGIAAVGVIAADQAKPPAATAKTRAPAEVPEAAARDWRSVGHEPGSMKYSPLTEITPENVAKLSVAWTYDMGAPGNGYSVTPLVADNVMFLPVRNTTIVALRADTGKELWKTDLASLAGIAPNPSAGGRGISYWAGAPLRVAPRIVIATTNGFLVQLDAKTGKLVAGPAGMINLST